MTQIKKNIHADKVELILSQFEDTPILHGILDSILSQTDDIEGMFHALLEERTLLTAVGSQLDMVGSLVGEARQGRDDNLYRQSILTRISINTSTGTINDLLDIAKIYSGATEVRLWEHYPAKTSMFVTGVSNIEGIQNTLQTAAPAGVGQIQVQVSVNDDALIPVEEGSTDIKGILPEDNAIHNLRIPCEVL